MLISAHLENLAQFRKRRFFHSILHFQREVNHLTPPIDHSKLHLISPTEQNKTNKWTEEESYCKKRKKNSIATLGMSARRGKVNLLAHKCNLQLRPNKNERTSLFKSLWGELESANERKPWWILLQRNWNSNYIVPELNISLYCL